jgi:hypothetical protein
VIKVITTGVTSGDMKYPELKGGNLEAIRAGKLELYPLLNIASFVTGDYGAGASHAQDERRLHWTSIEGMGLAAFGQYLIQRITTEGVYITFDKDVLSTEAAVTNWDQGRLSLDDVTGLIKMIAERHSIIGADVIGDYSPVRHAGGLWAIVQKKGEGFIDHPRVKLAPEAIGALNEATNIRLINLFSELMQ